MKRKIQYFIIMSLGLILLSSHACIPPGTPTNKAAKTKSVEIINQSAETIRVCDGFIAASDIREEITNPYMMFPHFPSGMVKVDPVGSYDYMQVVYDGMEKERLYHILVLKEATMRQYTPEELKAGNIYDKWYAMTLAELEACKYRIVYTGSED